MPCEAADRRRPRSPIVGIVFNIRRLPSNLPGVEVRGWGSSSGEDSFCTASRRPVCAGPLRSGGRLAGGRGWCPGVARAARLALSPLGGPVRWPGPVWARVGWAPRLSPPPPGGAGGGSTSDPPPGCRGRNLKIGLRRCRGVASLRPGRGPHLAPLMQLGSRFASRGNSLASIVSTRTSG